MTKMRTRIEGGSKRLWRFLETKGFSCVPGTVVYTAHTQSAVASGEHSAKVRFRSESRDTSI